MKIDFHTHNPNHNSEGITIYCHSALHEELPEVVLKNELPFCAGLHPWFLPDNWEIGKAQLNNWYQHPQFTGLGECGLDRVKGGDWDKQEYFFNLQLNWAKENSIPFLVIHSVRTISECFALIKRSGYGGKVVFHDYMGNAIQTDQLLKSENIYFSLGRALDGFGKLLREWDQIDHKSFSQRIFLETDDSSITISERYHQLSKLLSLDSQEIEEEMIERLSLFTPKLTP